MEQRNENKTELKMITDFLILCLMLSEPRELKPVKMRFSTFMKMNSTICVLYF